MRGVLIVRCLAWLTAISGTYANPLPLQAELLGDRELQNLDGGGCNEDYTLVRKEWSVPVSAYGSVRCWEDVADICCRRALSKNDRKAYTEAVLCLQSLPPRSSPSDVPGARSRFDDFVAVHINQTGIIHHTVSSQPQISIPVRQ